MSDLNINYEKLIEIEFENFNISYNLETKQFVAHHFNEEKYEEDILLEDENNRFEDDIYLFDEYTLTIEEFNKFKQLILKEIN